MSTAFVGAGMFFLGWYAHAWLMRPRDEAPTHTRWVCPSCDREKILPAELNAKVLVCNNCQVRLTREPA